MYINTLEDYYICQKK